MRYLALDVGDRRIGLAVGDGAFGQSRALPTLRRSRRLADDVSTLARIVAQEEVDAIVIGLPLMLSGTVGPQARRAQAFAAACASLGLPIELYDERNTTVEAIRRGATDPDAGAARVLLEDYLATRR
ncbi:MAG: Holliday junction resolvase RuvX [Candidatus Limnocylindrales bacterium]